MPAPYRYVIDREGVPVDAIDGTIFSGWIQPADVTIPADGSITYATNPGGDPIVVGDEDYDHDTPGAETYPDDIRAAAVTAFAPFAGLPSRTGGFGVVEHTAWHIVASREGDDDPFGYSHLAQVRRGADSEIIAAQAGRLYWHDEWRPEAWPDGTIGYEVEVNEVGVDDQWLPLADPQRLDLQVATTPNVVDGTQAGLIVRAVLNDNWSNGNPLQFDITGISVAGSPPPTIDGSNVHGLVERAMPASGIGAEETADLAVTDFAAAYTGAVALEYAVTAGGAVDVDIDGDNGTMTVYPGLSWSGTYLVRPPRYRWIYGTDETITYRRITGRADGLAGGAAPRNYPRPKSAQASNRTTGGFL